MLIRPAEPRDDEAIWRILAPVIRAGETYALPVDMSRADALAYWRSPDHEVFVAEQEARVVGTYYMRPNQPGGGGHVANCGYMTAWDVAGRGIGRAMGIHSLDHARAGGFRSMQFNFVVATNDGAVRLWQSLGFEIVGRLKEAFHHPRRGYVDALVMQRLL